MKKRVLIMSASAGSGHVKAAEALEKKYRSDERVAEVRHVDVLQVTNKLFRDIYSKLYIGMTRSAPQMLGALYRASDEPWKGDTFRLAFDRLNTGPLVKLFREFQPDITICTHFMPAGVIAHLLSKGETQTRLSIVVTDFDCHAMWLARVFHRYYVALDETKYHLETLGMPRNHITVSGIPIDDAFIKEVNQAQKRSELGLHPDKPVILLSAGAVGGGPTLPVTAQLMALTGDFQVVVICSRSQELKTEIEKLVQRDKRFSVLGYCNRMHDYMHTADLLIGKPGGLTTAEALASGLPMAILAPIPGQEERNSDHLLEEGIAIRCNDLTTVAFKVGRLIDNPERLAAMKENARRFARPDAAQLIVDSSINDTVPAFQLDSEQRKAMSQIEIKP